MSVATAAALRRPWPHLLATKARYVRAFIRRFRVNFLLAFALFAISPIVFMQRYPHVMGGELSFGRAFHHVYFLLFGQPSLEYVDDWVLESLNLIIPPVGIATVVDGIVRSAYLFFAMKRADKEWVELISESLKGHVVVCGAGRVGFRVVERLLALQRDVVVVEKREDAPFVGLLRDSRVPVLIDDVRSPTSLRRVNIAEADALVCATDDDLANLNIGLDARRANPKIRVVLRLFDDDLVESVKANFDAEAHSTSALAAPALALAALDPRISHSFEVGEHLMVVSTFEARGPMLQLSVGQLRDQHGGLVLCLRRNGANELHPRGETKFATGDEVTVQCTFPEYLALRTALGDGLPPRSSRKATS